MSRYIIEITEIAEKDLIKIGLYISQELLEPEIARKLVDKIATEILTSGGITFSKCISTG